jgi:hypothetical protein
VVVGSKSSDCSAWNAGSACSKCQNSTIAPVVELRGRGWPSWESRGCPTQVSLAIVVEVRPGLMQRDEARRKELCPGGRLGRMALAPVRDGIPWAKDTKVGNYAERR